MITLKNIYSGQIVTTCTLEALSMLMEGGWILLR